MCLTVARLYLTCCAVWAHLPAVDWQQHMKGQLKAAVRPDAVLGAELQQRQEQSARQQQEPRQSSGAPFPSSLPEPAGVAGGSAEGVHDAAALQALLQQKLRELEQLSQQLAAVGSCGGGGGGVKAEGAAGGSKPLPAASSPRAGAHHHLSAAAAAESVSPVQQPPEVPEEPSSAHEQVSEPQGDPEGAEAMVVGAMRQVAAQHQRAFGRLQVGWWCCGTAMPLAEAPGLLCWCGLLTVGLVTKESPTSLLTTPPPCSLQAGQTAWSGSDSDDDVDVLLGVAIEGAVSPGTGLSDVEQEEVPAPPARWV